MLFAFKNAFHTASLVACTPIFLPIMSCGVLIGLAREAHDRERVLLVLRADRDEVGALVDRRARDVGRGDAHERLARRDDRVLLHGRAAGQAASTFEKPASL